jgi:sugar diacid utilization regulator
MDEIDVKVIIGLADNDMNLSKVASNMFCHRNTALYHVKKIQTATGLDPLKFYDLCKLVQMVKEERKTDG